MVEPVKEDQENQEFGKQITPHYVLSHLDRIGGIRMSGVFFDKEAMGSDCFQKGDDCRVS